MNSMAPAQSSFEEARRRHLIEATVEAVADVGFKAASLSQIARRANVSTGLYAHYFRDKDGLLEATLRFLAARLAAALRERLRTATTPRERLLAVVDAALGDQEFDRRTSAVWLAFWGQIAHSDRFQRIQYAYQRRLHTNLRHAFRACVPADRIAPCATIVAGLIDGLWLQSHAYKAGTSADEARATVHDVVAMLIESSGRGGASSAPTAPVASAVPAAASISEARPADVEQARRGASAWMASSPRHRADVLRRCAQLVAEHRPSLAALDAAATGRRVIAEIEFFVPRCADVFSAAAERAYAPICVHHELGGGVIGTEIAAGLVRATAHWSAPLLDLCRAAADALSAGSALVIDMPLASRAVAFELEGLLTKAGVPRGLVGLRFGDEGDVAPRLSAAVILKGADVSRAIEAVLAARDPGRRTPDLSEIVLFVDKAALRAAETAATAWCKRAALAMDPTCGSPVKAAALPSVTAAATLVHGGQPDEATILRLRDAQAPLPTGLFAPVLRIVPFDSDRTLLATLDRTGFDSVAIFAGDDRHRADEIARVAPAPFCTIDAYDLTRERAREFPPAWTVAGARAAPNKRVLAFPNAPA